MKVPFVVLLAVGTLALSERVSAGDLDTTGFTTLWASHPELTGTGVTIGQVEAEGTKNTGNYQVNPASLGLNASEFSYYDTSHPYGGSGASFSSALASDHAVHVGRNLYGATGGAPGVSHVENFDAGYFINEVVKHATLIGSATYWTPVEIGAPIVNQSFTVSTGTTSGDAQLRAYYDAYAATYGTLFVNAALGGNALHTCYNSIQVAPMGSTSGAGVQLVAPGGAISFVLPYVSAAAAVLRQAAEAGDFDAQPGVDPTDSRVLKAGLLNGATKTDGWTHTSTAPLDASSGAGVLNVNGAYETLSGGGHARSSSELTALNTISTTSSFTAPISAMSGWDLRSLTATTSSDAVGHYFFDLTSETSPSLTATLTWNSIVNLGAGTDLINNFDLVLVDTLSHSIVWSSSSTDQNIEHIYLTDLAASKYDLQVVLHGGSGTPALTDTYAVAWAWQSRSTSPVPESDHLWFIGALCAFIAVQRGFAAWKRRA